MLISTEIIMINKVLYIHDQDHARQMGFAYDLVANKDQPHMLLNLAKMYERGEPFFDEPDWDKALFYHQQAILAGVYESYYHLARWSLYGLGPHKKDPKRAKTYLNDGADQKNAHCLLLLARWYDKGWFGEEKQPIRALAACRQAAKQGLAEAWRELARCYIVGTPYFSKPDITQAMRCRYYQNAHR